MPSIADQVATIEHDLAAALAQIDALNASNAALSSANASLQRDNVGLQLEINDMKHYVDDTRAMVEKLSQSALDMLRASRRQVGTPSEVIPYAPGPRGSLRAQEAARRVIELDGTISKDGSPGAVLDPSEILDKRLYGPTPISKQGAAPETSERSVGKLAVLAAPYGLDAKIAALPEKWPAQQAVAEIMAGDSGDEQPAAKMHVMEGWDVGTPMPPNRFEPLPIFLQRDTAFDASANVRPIFG